MRVRARIVFLAAAAAICARPAPTARACSHPSYSGPSYLVSPLDGAVAVPTNVVVAASEGVPLKGLRLPWFLIDPSGGQIPLVASELVSWGSGWTRSVRLTAAAPLAPSTFYRVVQIDGGVVTDAGSFTTGVAVDTEAPAAPVLDGVDVGLQHSCDSIFQCCESEPRVVHADIRVAPAGEALVYVLSEGGTVLAQDTEAPLNGLLLCGMHSPSFYYSAWQDMPSEWMASGDTHELNLVARDMAGNESPPTAISISGDCSNDDMGTGELPPGAPAADDSGCAVTRPSARGALAGTALVLAIALVVTLARRRGAGRRNWRA